MIESCGISNAERTQLKEEIMDLLVDEDALRIINTPSVKQHIDRAVNDKVDKTSLKLSNQVRADIIDMFDEELEDSILCIVNNLHNNKDVKAQLAAALWRLIKDNDTVIGQIEKIAEARVLKELREAQGPIYSQIRQLVYNNVMATPNAEIIRAIVKDEITKKEYKEVFADTKHVASTNRPIKI
jgi:hypothetical protein